MAEGGGGIGRETESGIDAANNSINFKIKV